MSLKLEVEVQETQILLAALAEQPFKQVADLWFKIKSQAESQLQVAQQPPQAPAAQPVGQQPAPVND